MPIYLPWLTVSCAVLAISGVICAYNSTNYLVPLYLALAIILLVFTLKLPKTYSSVCLILPLFFAYTNYRTHSCTKADLSAYINRAVVLIATISASEAEHVDSNRPIIVDTQTLVFPEHKRLNGQALLTVVGHHMHGPLSGQFSFIQRQTIEIKGQVCAPMGMGKPWTFEEPAYKRKAIPCHVRAHFEDIQPLKGELGEPAEPRELGELHSALMAENFSGLLKKIRQHISTIHAQFLGSSEGSLLTSMVLGNKAVSLDKSILQAFRKIGLSHLVAASGFNLTIVVMVSYWLLRFLRRQTVLVTLIICGNVLIYAALAGLSASIVRAAITCLLVLIANYYHRRLHNLAALSFGLMVNTVIDPLTIIDIGAQLSYAAVAGIMLGAQPLENALSGGNKNKLIRIITASISVISAAQLSVLPIQFYYFWQVSMLFLPANLLIDPLVAPVTIVGFIASIIAMTNLYFLLPIVYYLDLIASLPLKIIFLVTQKLAALDLAVINTGQPSLLSIIFYYCTLTASLVCLTKKNLTKKNKFSPLLFPLLSIFLFVLGLGALSYRPPLKHPVIILLPKSIIAISNQRQAICIGDRNYQSAKILAFYAASEAKAHSLQALQNNSEPNTIFLCYPGQNSVIVQYGQNQYAICLSQETQQPKNTEPAKNTEQSGEKQQANSISFRLKQAFPISRNQLRSNLNDIDLQIHCPLQLYKFYQLTNSLSNE